MTAVLTTTVPPRSPLVGKPLAAAEADQLAVLLKALADPARLRLLSLIQAAPRREACVCDLIDPLGLSQPTVSHHLRVLTDAGLLEREKRGVWAYYRVVPPTLSAVANLIAPPPRRRSRR